MKPRLFLSFYARVQVSLATLAMLFGLSTVFSGEQQTNAWRSDVGMLVRSEQGAELLHAGRAEIAQFKLAHAEATFSACLDAGDPDACLFGLLADETRHDDLPATAERATRLMSTVFIKDERYGTRSSTVILLSRHGELRFTERRFGANGVPLGQSSEQFKLAGSAASD